MFVIVYYEKISHDYSIMDTMDLIYLFLGLFAKQISKFVSCFKTFFKTYCNCKIGQFFYLKWIYVHQYFSALKHLGSTFQNLRTSCLLHEDYLTCPKTEQPLQNPARVTRGACAQQPLDGHSTHPSKLIISNCTVPTDIIQALP